ncbi:MAG: hypothetical protein HYY81_12350 [Deltaproteobacteria bacterium]|nr:hypothetical protein [Deltaproteobacteria bacterium]
MKTASLYRGLEGLSGSMGQIFWLLGTGALALQWIVLRITATALPPHWEAFLAGARIFGAAFLLSCAAEEKREF